MNTFKKNSIFVAVVMAITAFTSCTNVEPENVIDTEGDFLSALNLFSDNFFATPVSHSTDNAEMRRARGINETDNFETFYLNVYSELTPSILSEFENIRTMEHVLDFTERTGATIEFEPTEANVQFQLEVYTGGLEMGLISLVSEAKEYLLAIGLKGQEMQEMFNDNEIQKMLVDNDLPELALIHLAITYQLESTIASTMLVGCRRNCDDDFIFDVNLAGGGFVGGMAFCIGPQVKGCAAFVTAMWMVGVGRASSNHSRCIRNC